MADIGDGSEGAIYGRNVRVERSVIIRQAIMVIEEQYMVTKPTQL